MPKRESTASSGPSGAPRARAEKLLNISQAESFDMSPQNVPDLVRALQVYQVELDVRNEELRRTQVELAHAREREREAVEAAEKLRDVALFPEQNPNPVLRIARDGTILYANKVSAPFLAFWQLAAGKRLPDDWSRAIGAIIDAGRQVEQEVVCGDQVFSCILVPIVEAGYLNIYGRDVTEQKKAERALRESREDLSRAQAVAHIGSWRLDVRRDILSWSDETYRIFGIPRGAPMTYETFLAAVHPDDRQYVDEKWAAALRGEPYDLEHRIIVDGKVKWVREQAELEFDTEGSLQGGFGTTQDITELKQIEDEMQAAGAVALSEKKRLETVMETLPVGVAILDAQGGNIRSNRAFEQVWGGPAPEARSVSDYAKYKAWWVDSGRPVQPEEWASARAVQKGETVVGQLVQIERFDGKRAFVINSAAPTLDAAGRIAGCAVAIVDVTQRVESEQQLRLLSSALESAANGMAITDRAGRIIWVNPAFTDLTGYSKDEAVGQNPRILKSFRNPPELYEEMWGTISRGETWHGQLVNRRKDGSLYDEEMSITPVRAGGDEITHFIAVKEDISRRKAAEERLRLFSDIISRLLASDQPQEIIESLCREVMEHLDCDVFFNFLIDEKENCLRLNACAGVPDDRLAHVQRLDIGTAVCGCVAREGRRIAAENIQSSTDPRTGLVRSLGIEAYACHPLVAQGQVVGTLSFGSKTKTAFDEDELALMRAVADHVAIAMQRIRLLQTLELHTQAAEAANRAKSQFLASMSHELRTPMNAILGMTELALTEQIPPSVRDYLQTAKESADLLLELLNEVLDFSRIEAGRFELDSIPFNVRYAVEQVVKTLSLQAFEKGLELVYELPDDLPDFVSGDPLRLRQVLTNLVGNAIKFTHKGEIVVRAQIEEIAGGSATLRFSVADTGIGIAPEDIERIFAPFTQAETVISRRYSGSGLGLTISQRLVNLMGGRMWVESRPGLGSIFYFTITAPVADQPAGEEAAALPELDAFRDVPVLVVTHSATNRRILKQMLASWAMAPEPVADAPAALAKIHQAAASGQPPPLVLADAVMPNVDGFTLAEWLHKDRHLARATVLMVSATDRQNFPQQCREAKALCLDKPITRSALFNGIAKALGLEGAIAERKARQPHIIAAAPARPLKILLAEDTPANQKLVQHVLGRRGHAVRVAFNGREAIDMVARDDFDLVLMDVQMPEMDGFEATEAIRKLDDAKKAAIAIVAMTAHALKGDDERCLAAGMDAYLSKPIKAEEMIELVERLAELKDRKGGAAPAGDAAEAKYHKRKIQKQKKSPSCEGQTMERTLFADQAQPDCAETPISGQAADLGPQPAPPAFNLDNAVRKCFGKYEIFQEMVDYFFQEADQLTGEMQAALKESDSQRLYFTAHRLKNTVIFLGVDSAKDATARVEQMGMSGDLGEAPAALARLGLELNRLKEALAQYRK
jgi:two-component system sensor histidine kinase/response regulator